LLNGEIFDTIQEASVLITIQQSLIMYWNICQQLQKVG